MTAQPLDRARGRRFLPVLKSKVQNERLSAGSRAGAPLPNLLHRCFPLTAACAFAVIALLLTAPAQAQKGPTKGFDLGIPDLPEVPAARAASDEDPITYSAEYSLASDGKSGTLRITATVQQPWHTYSVTQPPGGPLKTDIKVDGKQVQLSGPIESDKPPHVTKEEEYPGIPIQEHTGRVVWTAPLQVVGQVAPESELEVTVSGLVCMNGRCQQVTKKLKAKSVASLKEEPAIAFRAPDTHADVTVRVEPAEAKPGSDATLVITIKPDVSYHVYPFVEGSADKDFRTLIVPTEKSNIMFAAPTTSAPTETVDLGSEKIAYHAGPVEWRVPLRVPATMPEGKAPLEILIGFMTCTDQTCDPPAGVAASGFLNVVASPGGAKQSPFTIQAVPFRDVAKQPQLASWVDFKAPNDVVLEEKPVEAQQAGSLTLTTLLAALAGGFILNFMPCVLPVIGLKVMGFVEQAGSARSEVIKLNLAYVLGIVSVMWVLAAITIASKNAFGWGEQFTILEFKLAMAGLVFAMSLSFLGVWEIPIPGFATSYRSNQLMEREGVVGAFAKGLLTTILATPCSGPFLGFVFAVTLTLSPLGVLLIYTLVGVGMGLPFLVLCLRPELVRHLPKPGPWMETLKEFLAFPLLLTVVYFVASIGEEYRIATLSTLIAVWFGCWLVGKVPAYADRHKKVINWTAALASILVWGMVSFSFLGPSKAELPWQPYSPERLAALRSSGKTVMIDFTANWCMNCQYNTHFAIEKPRVVALVDQNEVVPLLADWTEPSEAIAEQIGRLGSKTIPLLAVYPPDPNAEPIILKDIITENMLLEALKKAGPSQEPSGRMTSATGKPVGVEAR
ncbi:MAG: protein-disulfide reductase DsbD family protein [Aureliella sp.]